MEFRQLRYFLAVAEEANLTAASRRLHVSQPPITRQIRQLEQELGVTLFLRSSKGVTLTSAGASFLAEARRLVTLSQNAIERCRAADRGEIGHLDVGYFGSTIHTVVPTSIRRFMERYPEVAVRIHRAGKAEQIARLRDGRLGIGFARFFPLEPDLASVRLADEPLWLAEAVNKQVAKDPTPCPIADLDGRPIILFPQGDRPSFADHVLALLSSNDVSPSDITMAEDVFVALAMTMVSGALCVVPESVARLQWPELSFRPIGAAEASAPVSCLFLKAQRSPVVDAFLACIEDGSILDRYGTSA
ncbi:LysR substrate-binding domain-containing protein [Sphingopyxis sp. MC1]|uniref:LysR substrate-binding domain-containing protein n=1 Tax=Sphingopyxis sp. MC1 TaxID=1174684 RepID=UPI0002D1A8EA|nr:LysR substrate-binding domain-containing protein [Sphingopyxis sp. MC1]ENY82839.1 LysR family transcriptional regulator [Sphingopyxis sp. MC1]MBN2973576.1 LysR family transcriptional regulator [Roseomonas aeriglobus]